MSTGKPLRPIGAAAILAAARAVLRELPAVGPATTRAGATRAPYTPEHSPMADPPPVRTSRTVPASLPTPASPPVPAQPLTAASPPHGATRRNTAQQNAAFGRTNPRRSGVQPRQMMAARLLLAGRGVAEVAAAMGVHPYTVSRWKRDPLFEAELRRQVERATRRNKTQHVRHRRRRTNPMGGDAGMLPEAA